MTVRLAEPTSLRRIKKAATSLGSAQVQRLPVAVAPTQHDGYVLSMRLGRAPLWVPGDLHKDRSWDDSILIQAYYKASPAGCFDQRPLDIGAFEFGTETWSEVEWMPYADVAPPDRFLGVVRRVLSFLRRETLNLLQRVNCRVGLLLRKLERPQRLHELLGRQRAWHLLHGAHPPRTKDLLSGPVNLLGAFPA